MKSPGTGWTNFEAPTTTDVVMQTDGQSLTINTRHQCISAMKEYQDKSLEELRYEDYTAGRNLPPFSGVGTVKCKE